MTHYFALVDETASKDAFGVIFPDCPGCYAVGRSFDEAMGNAVEALREWMADRVASGFEPPPRRTAPELRADRSLAEDFGSGSVVASIPLLLDSGRPVRANISLDAGLLASIDAAAKLRGLTRSAFRASAAREKIAEAR